MKTLKELRQEAKQKRGEKLFQNEKSRIGRTS